MADPNTIDASTLKGVVATVVTTGFVEENYAMALSNLRSHNDRAGWHGIEYRHFSAQFVETGRDQVIEHALRENYDWFIQIDADAAPFAPDLVQRFVRVAYNVVPDAVIVGAYCQLKAPPYLPTIDTGTGHWEPWFPHSGIIPVIRTGGHCHFGKTAFFRRYPGPPFYHARRTIRPIDAMKEADNFARTRLHGLNPLTSVPEWETLFTEARALASKGDVGGAVGEDSGFCDQIKAHGGAIYVDTSIVAGHIAKQIIVPDDLKRELDTQERRRRLACGLME